MALYVVKWRVLVARSKREFTSRAQTHLAYTTNRPPVLSSLRLPRVAPRDSAGCESVSENIERNRNGPKTGVNN